MTTRRSYTADSITRALDSHRDAGRITGWRSTGNGRFVIGLNRADDLTLRSLHEVHVFLAGLASAHLAPERPWLRLTCGCLDNEAGAHQQGCSR